MAACPRCGKQNEADARFCSACGLPLVEEAPTREVRKTVTVLFCDVTGSTALGERLDPEATRKLMARYFDTARGILERHGASVEKFIGDAVMAVFGIPQVHEDDALRAARAALELRDSVTELALRIGVNTGEVVAGSGETLVTGDAVNVAARLEQAAAPGDVLLGEQTYRLVRDAVEAEPVEPVEAKGKPERLGAYRLTGIVEGAPPFARRLDSPLVGREEELAQLEQAYARAVRERSCHLFTLLGAPGIGKSRLSQEFLARLGDEAMLVSGHCLSYGDGITYWPLVEILRDLGEPTHVVQLLEGEPDARRIVNDVFAGVGLAEGAVRPEETSRAVRKLFEALAREQPLVVLLDDLQWAEPTFLDLVEHVADLSREAPILLLCPARPDLLDSRPSWSGGKHNATTLLLEPLSDDDAETLIANLLAGSELDAALRERISSTSEGNPLFVEQMLAMLSQDAGEAEVLVPPTIQALLAARLDRLEREERELLERASVVGKEFWQRAVVELGAEPAALEALVRKELIRPHRSTVFTNDDAYRFRHQLIRDATYEAIPKELRAELHERFAGWLEGQLSEFDEIVGYHLEQAYRYRAVLGELDERAQKLAERAGRLLGTAGVRAADRADIPAAINLLTRAVELLPADDERRLELLHHLGYAHFDAGTLEQAKGLFAEAADRATKTRRQALATRATVGFLAIDVMRESVMSAGLEGIEEAIATLEELGDPAGLAEAYREAGKVESHLGRTEQADRLFAKAVENARSSGSRRIESDVLVWRLAMQCWGYLPASAGVREATEVLDQRTGGMGEAFALVVRGRYRALQGDLAGGRGDIEAGRALIREYGADFYVAGSGQEHGFSELETGDPAVAEAMLREAYELYEGMSGGPVGATAATMLARALVEQGRLDEAERYARIGAENAAADDVVTQFAWRSVRARVLARRGDLAAGEALAREAVALAEPTDYLEERAGAHLSLAEVLALAGRGNEGVPAVEEAIRLFERKESVVGVERARARLSELAREPLAERE
jgi:class 3 adenylate cyclase/tetratricopeptide (TPR) repeat protein